MSVDQKVSDRKARRQKKKQTFFSSSSSNKTDLKIENNRNPVKKHSTQRQMALPLPGFKPAWFIL
jgi:hypothetical protein